MEARTTINRRRALGLAAAALTASLGLAACGGSAAGTVGSSASSSTSLDLVGFAVIKSAYDELGTAFAATEAGKGVTLKGSYGASGAQSRAVIAGQKADIVAFSLTPDLDNVAKAGLVDPAWNAGPNKGIVSRSVVVIAVRKGNPKGIKGWADLVKPGVGIVTADPGTSGSAKWNLLAAYSQALGATKDEAAAKAYLGAFVRNVVSWNDSGRTATDAFTKGTGDALISYENEAIAARAAGVELDYIVPESTLLIENPSAVTKTAPAQAAAFLSFVTSTDGQKILGSKGFRPIDGAITVTDVKGANDPAKPFPAIATLTTVADLGGWSAVNKTFFDKDAGLVTLLRK
ncbi:MAG: sulfate ABC transporter substrate-binding protein [Kineosporiaceae bacterium]